MRLIKSIANLKTLLRLLLLKNERQLLAYQRRESVLELDRKVEASSSSGGGDFEQLKAKLQANLESGFADKFPDESTFMYIQNTINSV